MSFIKFSREEVIGVRFVHPGTPLVDPDSTPDAYFRATGGYEANRQFPTGLPGATYGIQNQQDPWREWVSELRINTSDIQKYYTDTIEEGIAIRLRNGEEYCVNLSLEEVDSRITKAHLDPEMLSTALQYALVALDKLQERN